jgi:2-oxoisovalerate dehydrogenase E2 component (dihydrolipoyl transacylase)
MVLKIELPHVGESVTEAEIGKWLKSPGDEIEKYEPLVEIVTDKVSMELPAPASGVLTKILAVEGDTVEMGAVIAEMETSDQAIESEPETSPTTATPPANRIGTLVQGANVGPTGGEFLDTSLASSPTGDKSTTNSPPISADGRQRFSPVVKRLGAKHDIDFNTLTGTGRGGRVTKDDVLAAINTGTSSSAPMTESVEPDDEVIKPSAIRRTIAEHMVKSKTEIPHAWSAIEVDVTGMVEWRVTNKSSFEKKHGVRLTYLPVTLAVVSKALKSNPQINSSWVDGKIILKAAINVGIAVATEEGLVVPVVQDSVNSSIPELARQLDQAVSRARKGKLTLDDVRGGTFTLNNTGALGSILSGAIINHPQAAILTTEAIVKRPMVISKNDTVEVRSIMNVCLSFDHRIIDGAEAMRFLLAVKTELEAIDVSFDPGDAIDVKPITN